MCVYIESGRCAGRSPPVQYRDIALPDRVCPNHRKDALAANIVDIIIAMDIIAGTNTSRRFIKS